jgi:hypothetical protein
MLIAFLAQKRLGHLPVAIGVFSRASASVVFGSLLMLFFRYLPEPI